MNPVVSGNRRDAAGLLHDWGQRAQMVALMMWKHEIGALGICTACGRLPARDLPLFGPRCDIAVTQWELAQSALRHLSAYAPDPHDPRSPFRGQMYDSGAGSVPETSILTGPGRAVGRAVGRARVGAR